LTNRIVWLDYLTIMRAFQITSVVAVFVLVLTLPATFAQDIAGIHVGDSPNVLQKLGLKPIATEDQDPKKTVKYKLASSNELSVTYDSRANRIVYIESDWSEDTKAAETDFPGFKFGSTTLEDIRRTNGSNGFSYQGMAMNRTEDGLVAFNAYKIKDKLGLIVVFVTTLNAVDLRRQIGNRDPIAEDVSKNLKLDALILANENYLDEIWGKEKIYDKENKPITWGK
jgi:hypothetical protein